MASSGTGARVMAKLRLRTTLLIPLLLLSVGGTVISLLILREIVLDQVGTNLASDLSHSVQTYQNLASQRRELLARESALLADLPSLKALMTGDARTIIDGGTEFWEVSGSDLFALIDRTGKLIACYGKTQLPGHDILQQQITTALATPEHPVLLEIGGRIFEVSVQPLLFGEPSHQSYLGYVAVGYSVDTQVAREVSQAAAAEVSFIVSGNIVASTLSSNLQRDLVSQSGQLLSAPSQDRNVSLGGERYLATAVPLPLGTGEDSAQLVVLKSYEQASQLIRHVNLWVLTLVGLTFAAATVILFSISRTLTHPIQNLVDGARALALGNFDYQLNEAGVQEIRELSHAFESMRIELRRSQASLLDSERLATIGRMASSISHDLRHYLSAMYANAEFMSDGRLPQQQRDDLFLEVKMAVHGMTDLLDSLLLFTQTGRALHPSITSLNSICEQAIGLVRAHPAARNVSIEAAPGEALEASVDSGKLTRAVFNLLLNACQAARRGAQPARVTLELQNDDEQVRIKVSDTGPGVPASIIETMFLPFVSQGKESGLGLGLTLALQIAQEHGGTVQLEQSEKGTSFTLVLPASILRQSADPDTLQVSHSESGSLDLPITLRQQRWKEADR